MLLLIRQNINTNEDKSITNIDVLALRKNLQKDYFGTANTLSSSRHSWDILEQIEEAVSTTHSKQDLIKSYSNTIRKCEYESKEIVLKRRSAQMMNKDDSKISKNQFETLLASTLTKEDNPVNLVLFVHNVENLEEGLYVLLGNSNDENDENDLKSCLKDTFVWEKVQSKVDNLYFLQAGDFKYTAKTISCNQDIASNSAFSLGMLVQFDKQIQKYGAHRYKELYWNCGAIGQQLYLEATSLDLSATGIGCFLDDIFHEVLGIKNTSYQSLYHFTIGRGLFDTRLTNEEPYQN